MASLNTSKEILIIVDLKNQSPYALTRELFYLTIKLLYITALNFF